MLATSLAIWLLAVNGEKHCHRKVFRLLRGRSPILLGSSASLSRKMEEQVSTRRIVECDSESVPRRFPCHTMAGATPEPLLANESDAVEQKDSRMACSTRLGLVGYATDVPALRNEQPFPGTAGRNRKRPGTWLEDTTCSGPSPELVALNADSIRLPL